MNENENLVPKRRFKEFKNTGTWEQRKLKELTEVITKGTTPKDKSGKGSINFVKVENINKSSGEIDIKSKITENEHEGYLKRSQLKDGDILFSIAGTLGRTAIVKKELLPANTNQALAIIRLDEGDKNYITTFLNGRAAEDFIKKNPTVGAQPNLSLEQVGNLLIEIPSLEEQTKIGSFFKQLDDTIALHQRKLEKSKALKSAYLSDMFPAEGVRKPKRRFAGFTDDWEQRKLKELTEVITKGTTPKDKSGKGSINFVKVENINKSSGEIDIKSKITENEHEGYLKRSQLKDGDILFSIAGTLGRTAIVKKELLPANTNQALAIIRLDEGDKNYITTFLNGRAAEDFIKKNPTVGAQPNLSLEQVGNLLIEIPSLEEQTKIGSFFKQLDDTIALHQHKLEKLQNIKQAYLNEMFV